MKSIWYRRKPKVKEKRHGKKALKKRERRYIIREAELQSRYIRKLEADLFCLWKYVHEEGFLDEAVEYVEENVNNIFT